MATTSHVEHELLSKLIDELKVKANSDPEADVLAGRLLHRLKAESVTHTVAEYQPSPQRRFRRVKSVE